MLSDIVTVKAVPLANAGITKVEFSIDDQLRSTVTKPPYEFKWDTIDEEEGRHTLIVAMFDSDGRTAKKRIKVEVDNGLSQGIKPHADKCFAALRKGVQPNGCRRPCHRRRDGVRDGLLAQVQSTDAFDGSA